MIKKLINFISPHYYPGKEVDNYKETLQDRNRPGCSKVYDTLDLVNEESDAYNREELILARLAGTKWPQEHGPHTTMLMGIAGSQFKVAEEICRTVMTDGRADKSERAALEELSKDYGENRAPWLACHRERQSLRRFLNVPNQAVRRWVWNDTRRHRVGMDSAAKLAEALFEDGKLDESERAFIQTGLHSGFAHGFESDARLFVEALKPDALAHPSPGEPSPSLLDRAKSLDEQHASQGGEGTPHRDALLKGLQFAQRHSERHQTSDLKASTITL